MNLLFPHKEHWHPGEEAWFEYHCLESNKSNDAELWHRSHQEVTVLGVEGPPNAEPWEGTTWHERADAAMPKTYRVRFPDGHEGAAWEDELMTDRAGFYRPDPPRRHQ